jgi:hypothetical protein
MAAALAGCAGQVGYSFAPGTPRQEVERVMGTAAERRAGPGGETVLYYPQGRYGWATYAARFGADERLIAMEQRLTEENIAKVVHGKTTREEVRGLLGPPFEPITIARMQREIWTYPMQLSGNPTPRWFLVQMSPDGVVRETYLMDDPDFVPKDSGSASPP